METEVLAKVASSGEDQAKTKTRGPEAPKAAVSAADAPTLTREQALEQRYVEQMNALLADADEQDALVVFAEVVTWKLAVLAYRCGPAATEDMLRRFGGHLQTLAQQERAQREAEEARKQGRLPH